MKKLFFAAILAMTALCLIVLSGCNHGEKLTQEELDALVKEAQWNTDLSFQADFTLTAVISGLNTYTELSPMLMGFDGFDYTEHVEIDSLRDIAHYTLEDRLMPDRNGEYYLLDGLLYYLNGGNLYVKGESYYYEPEPILNQIPLYLMQTQIEIYGYDRKITRTISGRTYKYVYDYSDSTAVRKINYYVDQNTNTISKYELLLNEKGGMIGNAVIDVHKVGNSVTVSIPDSVKTSQVELYSNIIDHGNGFTSAFQSTFGDMFDINFDMCFVFEGIQTDVSVRLASDEKVDYIKVTGSDILFELYFITVEEHPWSHTHYYVFYDGVEYRLIDDISDIFETGGEYHEYGYILEMILNEIEIESLLYRYTESIFLNMSFDSISGEDVYSVSIILDDGFILFARFDGEMVVDTVNQIIISFDAVLYFYVGIYEFEAEISLTVNAIGEMVTIVIPQEVISLING